VLAGNGGIGTSGNGGSAGNVSNVTADGSGFGFTFNTNFNRVIAGNGGDSFGARGAGGGSVTTVVSTSKSSSLVVAAGRGGDGLVGGGNGGNVTGDSNLNASAALNNGFKSKLLIVAGDGGDVYGAPATSLDGADPLAFGEISGKKGKAATGGKAGNGGSIVSVKQSVSGGTHTDLIAGNGGNTINYGTTLSFSSGVGNGGSIINVSLAGDAGNVRPGSPGDFSAAIKSYNNIYIGERMADYVASRFVFDPIIGSSLNALDDRAGNVGIVVGGKGTRAGQQWGRPARPVYCEGQRSALELRGEQHHVCGCRFRGSHRGDQGN
jgi:hypothetical protein